MKRKGAVIIYHTRKLTPANFQNVIRRGYLKNFNALKVAWVNSQVTVDRALNIYMSVAQDLGWGDPGGLHVSQFTTDDGYPAWGVYPVG